MNKKFKILHNLYTNTNKDAEPSNFLNLLHKYHHIDLNLIEDDNAIKIVTMEQFLKNKHMRIYNKQYLSNKVLIHLKIADLYNDNKHRKYLLSISNNNELLDNKFLPSTDRENIAGIWGKHDLSRLFSENEIDNLTRRTMLWILSDIVVILDLTLCKTLYSSIDKEKVRLKNKQGSWSYISNARWRTLNMERYYKIIKEKYTPQSMLNEYKSIIKYSLHEIMNRIDNIEVSDLTAIHNMEDKKTFFQRNFTMFDTKEPILSAVEKELSNMIWSFGYQLNEIQGFFDFRKRLSHIKKGIKNDT